MASEALSDRDIAVLAFEARWARHVGAKEDAIRRSFRMTSSRYYQVLNSIIDKPAAMAHDPQLVKRLLRARQRRTVARVSREFRPV